MNRINIRSTDEDGITTLDGWFDLDAAERFDEDTEFDGNNMVSVSTGSQWEHEILWYTAGGRWVLGRNSQWQGVRDSYEFVRENHARDWLILNNRTDAVERLLDAVEDERGPGRPDVGPIVSVRLPEYLLREVDRMGVLRGLSRAATIRGILTGVIPPYVWDNDDQIA